MYTAFFKGEFKNPFRCDAKKKKEEVSSDRHPAAS